MKHRTFMKLFNSVCSGRGVNKALDVSKISDLSEQTRWEMVKFLVRHRMQIGYTIPQALIPMTISPEESSWLQAMGYLYQSKNKAGYVFVHTSEARIK